MTSRNISGWSTNLTSRNKPKLPPKTIKETPRKNIVQSMTHTCPPKVYLNQMLATRITTSQLPTNTRIRWYGSRIRIETSLLSINHISLLSCLTITLTASASNKTFSSKIMLLLVTINPQTMLTDTPNNLEIVISTSINIPWGKESRNAEAVTETPI